MILGTIYADAWLALGIAIVWILIRERKLLMRWYRQWKAKQQKDYDPYGHGHVYQPFSAEQVKNMNTWQSLGYVHPYTCINGEHGAMVAYEDGWRCTECGYKQEWTRRESTEPPPPNPIDELVRRSRENIGS